MQHADKQEALFTQVASRIEEIDNLIRNEVQPVIASVKELTESKLNKALASANLESELAEIGFWTANYQRLQTPEAKAEIDKKIGYFEKVLADFESYDLTSKERQIAQTVRKIFGEIKTGIGEVVALEDAMNTARERFIALRIQMDDMLDDQIQPLARQHLSGPRAEAEEAAQHAVNALRTIIPLYVLCALAIGALLVVFIMRPLQRLTKGTEQVGQGDLEYRIPERGTDEFNDLAQEFNRMVSQLQATTVTRDLLEESENKLRDTVAELRRDRRARALGGRALQAERSPAAQGKHGGDGFARRRSRARSSQSAVRYFIVVGRDGGALFGPR